MGVVKIIILLSCLVLSACLESQHDILDAPSENLPGDSQTRQLGKRLYNESCASCHGSIDNSAKKNTTAFKIKSSIDSIPAMRNLQNRFSDEEITALVVALSPESENPQPEEPPGDGNNFNETLYNQGISLYSQKNCASCHGANILESEKRNRNAFQILAAVGPNSPYNPMRSIVLTQEEAEALEYALNNEPPVDDTPVEAARYIQSIPMGTRYYLRSKMRYDFLHNGQENDARDTNIANTINTYVNAKFVALSGGCSAMDEEAFCKSLVPTPQSMQPNPSSIRASVLSFACETVLSIDKSTDNALLNAGLTSSSPINTTSIDQVWERLIPTRPLSNEIRSAIQQINTTGQTHNLTNKEIWSLILLQLCKSPHYEVL